VRNRLNGNAEEKLFAEPGRKLNPDFDSSKNNSQLKWQVTGIPQACATTFSLFVIRRTLGGGLRPMAENSL